MIYAIAGQKGGSGKSTTAINLADELFVRGNRVLLADADPQRTTLTWSAIASEAGHDSPVVIALAEGFHRAGQLPRLAQDFDHVVIDCPPRHGATLRSALVCADVAVLPCRPTPHDLNAMAETLDLIEDVLVLRPVLPVIVMTQRLPRTVIGRDALRELKGTGLRVCEAELRTRVAYQEAHASGLGVTRYAPRSKAAQEVRNLVDELTNLGAINEHSEETRTRAA